MLAASTSHTNKIKSTGGEIAEIDGRMDYIPSDRMTNWRRSISRVVVVFCQLLGQKVKECRSRSMTCLSLCGYIYREREKERETGYLKLKSSRWVVAMVLFGPRYGCFNPTGQATTYSTIYYFNIFHIFTLPATIWSCWIYIK